MFYRQRGFLWNPCQTFEFLVTNKKWLKRDIFWGGSHVHQQRKQKRHSQCVHVPALFKLAVSMIDCNVAKRFSTKFHCAWNRLLPQKIHKCFKAFLKKLKRYHNLRGKLKQPLTEQDLCKSNYVLQNSLIANAKSSHFSLIKSNATNDVAADVHSLIRTKSYCTEIQFYVTC